MGQRSKRLNSTLIQFIEKQKLFFVGTAGSDTTVNISPKGMDSLRVLGPNRVVWLNVTGSGNETAAHVQDMPRMTIMFCAFEGDPLILRLYGKAKVIHKNDQQWNELISLFDELPGSRQIFDLEIDLVQGSCGTAVPFFDYQAPRNGLKDWAEQKGQDGIEEYWQLKNQTSLDGKPTNIVQKNLQS